MTTVQMTQCNDKKCPAHGGLSLRGAVFTGKVVSAKEKRSAVVGIDYTRKVRKYERLEKRRSKLHCHVPGCIAVKEGDLVEVAECRKLSRTKSHVITKVIQNASASS